MSGIKEQVRSFERELLLDAMELSGFSEGKGTLDDVADLLLCNREHVKHLRRKHGVDQIRRKPKPGTPELRRWLST